jgi:hypothetical protein
MKHNQINNTTIDHTDCFGALQAVSRLRLQKLVQFSDARCKEVVGTMTGEDELTDQTSDNVDIEIRRKLDETSAK